MSCSQRGLSCKYEGCTETHFRGGMCLTHWNEQRWGSPCSIPKCGLPVRGRGWCDRHYRRWMRWGDPLQIGGRAPRIEGQPRTCDIKGCTKPHDSRGWCSMHYTRWRTWGDPNYVARALRPRAKLARHNPALVAKVAQLHDEGQSYSQIGEQVGLTKDTVYGIYRRSKAACPTT